MDLKKIVVLVGFISGMWGVVHSDEPVTIQLQESGQTARTRKLALRERRKLARIKAEKSFDRSQYVYTPRSTQSWWADFARGVITWAVAGIFSIGGFLIGAIPTFLIGYLLTGGVISAPLVFGAWFVGIIVGFYCHGSFLYKTCTGTNPFTVLHPDDANPYCLGLAIFPIIYLAKGLIF